MHTLVTESWDQARKKQSGWPCSTEESTNTKIAKKTTADSLDRGIARKNEVGDDKEKYLLRFNCHPEEPAKKNKVHMGTD